MAKPSDKTRIKIVSDPENKVALEVMEKSIVSIAEGARQILGSRLSRRAVAVLLRDATNESLVTINRVLDAAASLDKTYLRLAALLLAATLTGACAGAPRRPVAVSCNPAPTWTVDAGRGRLAGVFVCYGSLGELLYTVKALPPAAAPAPAAHEESAAESRARKIALLNGADSAK